LLRSLSSYFVAILHHPNDAATDMASYLVFCVVPLFGWSIWTEKVMGSVDVNELEGISLSCTSDVASASCYFYVRLYDLLPQACTNQVALTLAGVWR
jgi:hypothetical protein